MVGEGWLEGRRLPTPPIQPQPPDPTPENLPKPLARWATTSLSQNMQCNTKHLEMCAQLASLRPSFLPPLIQPSPFVFSDFIECNLLIQISEEQPNRTSFSFSKSKHFKGQQTNFFFSISVYPFSLSSFLSLVNVYENVLPPYEHAAAVGWLHSFSKTKKSFCSSLGCTAQHSRELINQSPSVT